MKNWQMMKAPSYTFDESDPVSLREHEEYLRNLQVIAKAPHQLVEADLVNWNTVEWNRYVHVRAKSKSPYATIWDYIEPPVGTYRWDRANGDMDGSLGRLQVVRVEELIPYGGLRFQWDIREQAKVDSYRAIYRSGPCISGGNPEPILSQYINPIKVYIDGNGSKIILDGYKRWKAAQLEGLTELKAWVYETHNDALKNRTFYCREAVKAGKEDEIPEGEFTLEALGASWPIYAKTIHYDELRKVNYPAIGDQIDALIKYVLDGDDKALSGIIEKVMAVKARFPKGEK